MCHAMHLMGSFRLHRWRGPAWERLRTCLWFWRGSVAVWGLRHSTRAGSEDGPKEGGRRQRWGKNGVGSVHGAPAQWLGSWLSANIVPTSCPRPETLGKREDPWGLGRVPSPALASPHQPAVSGVGSPGHPASPQVRPGHSHSTFAFSGSPWLKVQVLAAWPQAACLVNALWWQQWGSRGVTAANTGCLGQASGWAGAPGQGGQSHAGHCCPPAATASCPILPCPRLPLGNSAEPWRSSTGSLPSR